MLKNLEEEYVKYTSERNIALDYNKKLLSTNSLGENHELIGLGEDPGPRVLNMTEIQVGDNIRGKTITFDTSKIPDIASLAGGSLKAGTIQPGFNGIQFSIDSMQVYLYRFKAVGSPSVYANPLYRENLGGWRISDAADSLGLTGTATTVTIPDDDDYIVIHNDLRTVVGNSWSWADTSIVSDTLREYVKVGTVSKQTNIHSSIQPTWESLGGKKTLAMMDDIPSPLDLTNYVQYDRNRNIQLEPERKLLSGEGTLLTGTQKIKKTVSLLDLKVGEDNLIGSTISFNDLTKAVNAGELSGIIEFEAICRFREPGTSIVTFTRKQKISILSNGISSDNPGVYAELPSGYILAPNGVWGRQTEGTARTHLQGNLDYPIEEIRVTQNTLAYSGDGSTWSWRDTSVVFENPTTIVGDTSLPTFIKSKEEPVWQSESGKKILATTEYVDSRIENILNLLDEMNGRIG